MEECTEHSSCSVKGKVYLTFILFSKRKSILNILLSYSEQITDRRIGRCKYEGSTQLGRNAVNYSEISEFKMIHFISVRRKKAVLQIRIRLDPKLLPGSGSGIIVSDPDPAKSERADK